MHSNAEFRSLLYEEQEETTAVATPLPLSNVKRRRCEEIPSDKRSTHHEDVDAKEKPSTYIDRAALRRQAEKNASDRMPAQMGNRYPLSTETATSLNPLAQQRNKSAQELSPEEAQYLGGSEETTHIIRGLDTALLARVRAEIARVKNSKSAMTNNEPECDRIVNDWARKTVSQFVLRPNEIKHRGKLVPNTASFVHPLSRDFSTALKLVEECLKDRTALAENVVSTAAGLWYLYDLRNNSPTVLYRSKLGSTHSDVKMCILVDEKVRGRIMQAIEDKANVASKHEEVYITERNGASHKNDDEDIFGADDIGESALLETAHYKEPEEPTAATEAELSGRQGTKKIVHSADDLEILEQIKAKMKSAHRQLVEMDMGERKKKEELLEKLERVSQTGLSPEENPFSLKNASLIPLMNKRSGNGVVEIRTGKSEVAQPGEAESDKIDAEYGITQVDIDDFVEDDSICSARFFKSRRKLKSKGVSHAAISKSRAGT